MSRFTGTLTLDDGQITDAKIATGANIDSDKLQHLHKPFTNFALASGATPVARSEVAYVCKAAAATVRGFHALLYDTGTSTSCTFDLKKNGSTMLTGVITIAHTDADRAVLDATMASTALVAGDVLTMVLAVSSATGATGPYAWAEIDETAG